MSVESLPHPSLDFFRSNHHPYYIFSLDYRHNSAGLISYYMLCHILNELGYEAYVIADEPAPNLRTPVLTNEIRMRHKNEGRKSIAVYGETTQGNPLTGDIVVRWILNLNGHIGVKVTFGNEDMIYYWDSMYAQDDAYKILWFPLIDEEIFHDSGDGISREHFCYYAHKYILFGDKQNKISDVLINNAKSLCQDVKLTPNELADILRQTKVLYSYEPSAIMGQAELCGCRSVFVRTPYLEAFRREPKYGIGFRFPEVDEIDINVDDVPEYKEGYRESYEYMKNLSLSFISRFIYETQAAANAYTSNISSADVFDLFIHRYGNIYIYGAGYVANHCRQTLEAVGVKPKGFVVSDSQLDKNESSLHGYHVIPLSSLSPNDENTGIVLAMLSSTEYVVEKELFAKQYKNIIRYSLQLK